MAAVKGKDLVFGLDIGTRSIVGTVGYKDGTRFHVVAQREKEHESRAMLDGQIHDIGKVGATIAEVKGLLEQDLGRKLTQVCIAAAGRVLRTVTTSVEYTYGTEKEILDEDIYALETMGVEQAYEEFIRDNDTDMQFYCVGYTAMRYYLNGYPIGNLEGHKARTAGVDLIATFLPDDVVDGLYKAVGVAGLQVANLTLEPIAAIQVAIPEKFRMLNLALVDVGAGTSDISITKEGAITAYGMIPIAGDSLTEILVQHCLVDFETAEQIKRKIGVQESIDYVDILGLPQTIGAGEAKELLQDNIQRMTKEVADCIRELNGEKPVSAVFVVGGGGMVPGYTQALAEQLGIAKERVAIRGEDVMQTITFDVANARKDSLMVTPIGICLSYYEQSNNFIFVAFNDQRVKLYDNGRLSVVEAAIAAGFPNENLFPKRGDAVEYTVDGKSRMVRGEQGEAAVITVNGQEGDIHTRIQNGDKVVLVPSTAGEAAHPMLERLPEMAQQVHITVGGIQIELPRQAYVNGQRQLGFYEIQNGDEIRIQNWYTVEQVAQYADIPIQGRILVNDAPARPNTKVYEGFDVRFEQGEIEDTWENLPEEPEETWEELPKEPEETWENLPEETEEIREESLEETEESREDTVDRAQENAAETVPAQAGEVELQVVVNRQTVTLRGKSGYVFVDIFDFFEFDLGNSQGRNIVTLLNGHSAQHFEELHQGDEIEIYWA
ncbi:MAG: cell division protein FtsA [Lachnospiraceae bacterium]|nr:cell division protein FtsA [Lachnospiraceae bacterium]